MQWIELPRGPDDGDSDTVRRGEATVREYLNVRRGVDISRPRRANTHAVACRQWWHAGWEARRVRGGRGRCSKSDETGRFHACQQTRQSMQEEAFMGHACIVVE